MILFSTRALRFVVAAGLMISPSFAAAEDGPLWIAPPSAVACPVNEFTYLRKVVHLFGLHGDLTLQMAADSDAHLLINGHIVRRKVTPFFESHIATETIDARPYLHAGDNTVLLLHHSWGPIIVFQRDGCAHAGVYLSSTWINSDSTWRSHKAEEFAPNPRQITGLPGERGDHRIRFAQFVRGALVPAASIFTASYDDSKWDHVSVVQNGPWPAYPLPSGVPGQREEPVSPVLLLAQGQRRISCRFRQSYSDREVHSARQTASPGPPGDSYAWLSRDQRSRRRDPIPHR